MNVDGWKIEESFRNTFAMGFKVTAHLHSEKSEYQQIDVVDTEAVGRLLLLDGKTMVSDGAVPLLIELLKVCACLSVCVCVCAY